MAALTSQAPPRQPGFALLVVLWTLGLLALLITALTGAGRIEAQIARALYASARAETAADSAVQEVVLRLLQGAWQIDGETYPLRVGDVVVGVRVTDEAGKVNPNYASVALLRSLLATVGVDAPTAAALASNIVDWRRPELRSASGELKRTQYEAGGLLYAPSNAAFDNVDQVGLVLGMTPDLFARLKPFLSVYQEGDVRLSAASAVVAAAILDASARDPSAGRLGFASPNRVAMIRADATAPGGGRFTREAIVRIMARPRVNHAPYQILTWDSPGQ
jgi:general secretion pathway protein K